MDDKKLNALVKAKVESGELSKEELKDLHELLVEHQKYKLFNKSEYFKPYPYQQRFYEAGKTHRYRFLCAGNRVGKTHSAAVEVFYHLSGLYPKWWKGRRFKKAINFWFFSVNAEQGKDVGMFELFGVKNAKSFEEIGSGSIPKRYIDLNSIERDGARILRAKIRHHNAQGKPDGWSLVTFKTSQSDQTSAMGSHVDLIWIDELPPFDDLEIYGQAFARTMGDPDEMASIILTGTPEKGNTKLVQHFREKADAGEKDIFWMKAGWLDAHQNIGGHITDSMIQTMMANVPSYQLEMRMNGEPILGDGLVFPFNIQASVIQPIEIPDHFKRIAAIDIGLRHETAVVWSAYDPDTNTIYITDIYTMSEGTPDTHAIVINRRDRTIPVVLPHDARNREKGTGLNMIHYYKQAGVNALSETFYNAGETYKGDHKNNDIDTGIVEISQRLQSGQLKIFANCQDLILGLQQYSYKKGVIDKSGKHDDLLDAFRYSVMSVAKRGKSKRETQINNEPVGINWRTI